ncbi:MAG: TetR/AcrR family transcriptional regulator [Clostridia bacterium]|nr:TetR/AcrR family transcriptional regulator [Clostridia bacterium]
MERKNNTTKLKILQVALKMFLREGYASTSAKAICEKLKISTGNMTYYFHTKEDVLAVLVEMLCDFQWKMMEKEMGEGYSPLLAFCMELTSMAAICENSEVGKEFYLTAYTHPKTLTIIRDNDARKAKNVFGEYCTDWTDVNYREAEMLVSGIEFATMMPTEKSAPLDVRIAGALDAIMSIYNVPKEMRDNKIEKVLNMDYLKIGKKVLKKFIKYTESATEHALENCS